MQRSRAISGTLRTGPPAGLFRRVIGGAILAAILTFGTSPTLGSTDEAARFIEEVGAEFLAVASAAGGSVADRTDAVKEFLERRTDLRIIARFTAGRIWRQMSDTQRDAYRLALRNLAARFLVKRIEGTEDPGYTVVRSAELPNNKGYIVTTQLTGTGMSDTPVDWRIARRNDEYRIVDVIVEGISLLVTYRSEVAAVLEARQNDVDGLIANLQERAGD